MGAKTYQILEFRASKNCRLGSRWIHTDERFFYVKSNSFTKIIDSKLIHSLTKIYHGMDQSRIDIFREITWLTCQFWIFICERRIWLWLWPTWPNHCFLVVMFKKRCSKVQLDMSWIDCQISNLLELVSCQLISMSPVDFHCFHNLCLLIRLSRKTKKLEYQKYLLTLDLGWSNKLSCKISAFYLENRKSCGHLKFQQATNKIKKS